MFAFHIQNRIPRTFALGVGMALPSLAHARARAAGNLTDIQYDSPLGIHYVEDPAYPGEPIVLYCMNNQRAWLHGMDGVNPPAYLQGYLTPDMFDSPQQYEECMGRLQRYNRQRPHRQGYRRHSIPPGFLFCVRHLA